MRIAIIAIVISLVGIVVNAFGAEERYLCVADMATGFSFNSKSEKWEQTNLPVDNAKYVVSKSNSDKIAIELKEVGKDYLMCLSEEGFNDNDHIVLKCVGGMFRYNKKTGRYLRLYAMGYVNGDSTHDTPLVEIGKCSQF